MLFRVALIAGVCALWPYAAQRLPSLAKRSEYRLKFSQIQVSPPPEHSVPANIIEQVEKLADLPLELSVLDEHLAENVANAFRKHPWVSKVGRVKKTTPAAVTVELEYRRPVAIVQFAGNFIPIDVNAVVLPPADFSPDQFGRLPVIQNITSTPAAKPGIVWNDPALFAAGRLADLLGDKWKALKLEAISVSRSTSPAIEPNDVQFELRGLGGSKILWGRAPGSDYPGELEPGQKIRRLENYLTEFGDYGQPHGPYEIDIRHWRENTRRPLIGDETPSKPPKNPRNGSHIQSTEGKRKTRG